MTDPEIESTIERVKAGWVNDYAIVVDAYHQRLRAAIAAWCPPGVEVDEIAHLAFVEAHRQLSRYTPGTHFFAWLCSIARHRLMTECEALRRSAKNRNNYLQHTLIQQIEVSVGRDETHGEVRLRWLDECLKRLKPPARELIERRYSKRESVGGIAAALGRSATALSVRLFALRRQLRDCIEQKWREAGAEMPNQETL